MRILLVRPHTELLVARRLQNGFLHLEPLELEIVAGAVPADDSVAILDLTLERRPVEVFRERLARLRPELIGFTGYSSNALTVKALARLAKEHAPDPVTVVGGIHATIVPADYAVDGIDLIVRGEGGTVFAEILQRVKTGKPLPFRDCALSPRDPGFAAACDLPPPAYPALREIPPARRDLVDRSRYFCVWTSSETKRLATMFPRVATVRTSIGCVYDCSFCVVHQLLHGKYLQREPEDVVAEIAALAEDYVYFVDDEMFLNERRMTRIAELLLERGIRKHYFSWARSDTITRHPELFRLWHRAGLSAVYVGLEVMDDAVLARYNKKLSAETNRQAVALLRDMGITLHANFLVAPDFSDADFDRLEQEVAALCPAEVSFTVLSPSPGTSDWFAARPNFICDPFRFYDCMHTLLPTRLPMARFYARFARLTSLSMRANPLRVNKIRPPWHEIARAIFRGTAYIIALRTIHRDYPHASSEHR